MYLYTYSCMTFICLDIWIALSRSFPLYIPSLGPPSCISPLQVRLPLHPLPRSVPVLIPSLGPLSSKSPL